MHMTTVTILLLPLQMLLIHIQLLVAQLFLSSESDFIKLYSAASVNTSYSESSALVSTTDKKISEKSCQTTFDKMSEKSCQTVLLLHSELNR